MRKRIFTIISFLAGILLMTSCLKDKVGVDWTSDVKGKMYAEIWNAGYQALGLAPVPDPVIFKFLVNIATDQPPTQDITVNLDVDSIAMKNYNLLKGTNYKLYPYIQILDPQLVIKAGTRNAYAHVKVWNANTLDACANFMAPIVIKSASGGVIPADPLNQGARLMALPISNPYAGTYNTLGYRIRPGNPTEYINAASPTTPVQEVFSTVDCKSVDKNGFGNYTAFNVTIQVTTNILVVNGVNCYKVICTVYNPADGTLQGGNWDSWHGDPAATPAPPADPSWINYYNPVTKQFVLNCYYNSSAGNRIMWEIHTRV